MTSKIRTETLDGSIIMAIGIIVNGVSQINPYLKLYIAPILTVFLISVLFFLYFKYSLEIVQGSFYDKRIRHPIQSFSIGTLVAATSVTIVAISYEMPALHFLGVILFGMNMMMWVLYLILVLRNYYLIVRQTDLKRQVHGVLLLACVNCQAIVISVNTLFGGSLPYLSSLCLILLGILAYVLGLLVILARYLRKHMNNFIDTWANTNCIIHGAASITGLAGIISRVLPVKMVIAIWIWVIVSFIVVETIELIRGFLRIRAYGWRQGILTYSMSQWARNFTFGMLLAFTIKLPLSGSGSSSLMIHKLQNIWIPLDTAMVFFLFFFEMLLLATNFVHLNAVERTSKLDFT